MPCSPAPVSATAARFRLSAGTAWFWSISPWQISNRANACRPSRRGTQAVMAGGGDYRAPGAFGNMGRSFVSRPSTARITCRYVDGPAAPPRRPPWRDGGDSSRAIGIGCADGGAPPTLLLQALTRQIAISEADP